MGDQMGSQEAPPGSGREAGETIGHVGSSCTGSVIWSHEQVVETQVAGWRGEEGQRVIPLPGDPPPRPQSPPPAQSPPESTLWELASPSEAAPVEYDMRKVCIIIWPCPGIR